ncbi:MAG TPA: 50S ribosomal protein L25/general stress protein Ctc [Kiloniellales bacterium]|nr:50S ribosomal protein L25/general stress protein Ctc [Kiloniellales bacterium]
MAEVHQFSAELRQGVGKGPARAARRAGRVPGVIYGAKKDPLLITVNPVELLKELQTGYFMARIYDVQIDGAKERVLPRDVQFDPVTDRAMHVDFLRVSADTRVTVDVPVEFINEEQSPGLERGGLLNIVRHEIEMQCRADLIPEHIEVDLAGLDIGDSVHISMIKLPEGVTPTIARDFTVATIAAPTVVQEEATEAAEGAEEEVPEGEEAEAEAEGEGETETKEGEESEE